MSTDSLQQTETETEAEMFVEFPNRKTVKKLCILAGFILMAFFASFLALIMTSQNYNSYKYLRPCPSASVPMDEMYNLGKEINSTKK
uniref:Uncharacterized protein n=1 Tax=Panagrolaimus sp. ES5 TaxID=591445 RepID=A0AC34F5D4_9BILA